MPATREMIEKRLRDYGQQHVLAFVDQLDDTERALLFKQIDDLDFDAIERMRHLLTSSNDEDAKGRQCEMTPADVVELAVLEERERQESLSAYGESALARGEVGVLLVAGGQGSRLGFEGPKGAYPIGPLSNASLFEIHARKVLALEQRYHATVPLYIMTSLANDQETKTFFKEHDFFGLAPDRVFFFTQGMWPALDSEGRLVLSSPGCIFMSPDGHGGTLSALQHHGLLDDMEQRGLRTLFYFQVDNPLVEVADARFIGLHLKEGADVSTKVCAKRNASEGLGVVALREGHAQIVEYSELTPEQMQARRSDGRLKFLFGSVAIHAFSFDFLKREADKALPLHKAFKKVPMVGKDGVVVPPESPNAYKFEKFIFDVIPDAGKALNVEFKREDEFSPVKNKEGDDSPATAKRDMVAKFVTWLKACDADVPCDDKGDPLFEVEIDPCFAMDAYELAQKIEAGLVIDQDLYLHEH